jgi:hypothetical protein
MAHNIAQDSTVTAILAYLNSLRDLGATDSEACELFGAHWRSKPHEAIAPWRSKETALELQADRALSAALRMPATAMIDVAAKLRLAFCIAAGSDWSSPIIKQLVLSAAIDASRLAEGRDREIERHYSDFAGSRDSLAIAEARAILAGWDGSALIAGVGASGEDQNA